MVRMIPDSTTYTFNNRVCDICYGRIDARTLKCTRCGEQYFWSKNRINMLVSWYDLLKQEERSVYERKD
jgi:ribosomal protein L40E